MPTLKQDANIMAIKELLTRLQNDANMNRDEANVPVMQLQLSVYRHTIAIWRILKQLESSDQ